MQELHEILILNLKRKVEFFDLRLVSHQQAKGQSNIRKGLLNSHVKSFELGINGWLYETIAIYFYYFHNF